MRRTLGRIFVAAAAISLGLVMSMGPWKVFAQQRKVTDQQVAEMKAAEREHDKDLQQEAHIASSVGREELARQRGYHRENEVPAAN